MRFIEMAFIIILSCYPLMAFSDYVGVEDEVSAQFSDPYWRNGIRLSDLKLTYRHCALQVSLWLDSSSGSANWAYFFAPYHQGLNGDYFFPGSVEGGPEGLFVMSLPVDVLGQKSGHPCRIPSLPHPLDALWVSSM